MQRGLTDKDRRRSASIECQALRDLVNKLKMELLQSQMEAQKVRDQLQCVIYLVRRCVHYCPVGRKFVLMWRANS